MVQKHWRQIVRGVRERYGLRSQVVSKGRRGHGRLVVEVEDGDTVEMTVSSSPKNVEHAVRGALREVGQILKEKQVHG